MVENLPAIQETQVQCLRQEDPLEKEMATHFSILAWRIPWTEEPGGVGSIGSQRVGHDLVTEQQMVKNLPGVVRDLGSIPGFGRCPGKGNGNPLQYSCLENSMDRRAWQAIVHFSSVQSLSCVRLFATP